MEDNNLKQKPKPPQAKGSKEVLEKEGIETDHAVHTLTQPNPLKVAAKPKITPPTPRAIDWIPIGVRFTDVAGAPINHLPRGQTCRCMVIIDSRPTSGQPNTDPIAINLTWTTSSPGMTPAVLMDPVTTPQSVAANTTQMAFNLSLRTYTGGQAFLTVRAATNGSSGPASVVATLAIL